MFPSYYRFCKTTLLKTFLLVSERKHNARRRTKTDSNRSLECLSGSKNFRYAWKCVCWINSVFCFVNNVTDEYSTAKLNISYSFSLYRRKCKINAVFIKDDCVKAYSLMQPQYIDLIQKFYKWIHEYFNLSSIVSRLKNSLEYSTTVWAMTRIIQCH